MGWLDENGYLYIADRRTDMVISGGVNIYPRRDRGGAASTHPDVVDAAVSASPTSAGASPCAPVVEPRRGTSFTAEALPGVVP